MKKIVFLFLLTLSVNVFAAGSISMMVIEPNGAVYDVRAWGQKSMGEETRYQIKNGDPALAKIIDLVNDQAGGKSFIRAIVKFNEDGSLGKIDVQSVSASKFESVVKEAFQVDGKSTTDISDIKAELQSK